MVMPSMPRQPPPTSARKANALLTPIAIHTEPRDRLHQNAAAEAPDPGAELWMQLSSTERRWFSSTRTILASNDTRARTAPQTTMEM